MLRKIRKLLILVIAPIILFSTSCGKNAVLEGFLNNLELPLETSEDLILLNEYNCESKKIKVTWTSTNENVISKTGKVTRKTVDTNVILIAEATYNKKTAKKNFLVLVRADLTTEILEKALNSVLLPSYMSSSLSFPSEKVIDGKTVSIRWKSSAPDVIDENGNLTRPKKDTEVEITATFILNKQSKEKKFMITVPKGEQYTNGEMWAAAKVYKGEIKGATLPEPQSDFIGAIYRKVLSSKDWWLGLEVVVTLPEFIPDENRTGLQPQGKNGEMRYLDNPSVYLGVSGMKESDVGLSWMIGSADATCSRVNYAQSIAYRPFWRYESNDGKNTFANAMWQKTEFYYYPGDKIRMSVYCSSENHLQLRIELLEETKIEKYAKIRMSYMLGKDYEKVFTSPEFESLGIGKYKAKFKRVCALDQVNNEAKPTNPTNAMSKNTIWHEVYLYREIDGDVYKVPMTSKYATALNSPQGANALGDFSNAFIISYDGVDQSLGGEVVTLAPNNGK